MRIVRALHHELQLVGVALQFLTRIPVSGGAGFRPEWLGDSARHFPLVGLIVGAFGAAVLVATAAVFPTPVAVGLSMAATIWLTGGFHEDGLADTCDGLGGSVSRERALEIMKDSRLGSYGALGLVLVLGIKAATLVGLAEDAAHASTSPASAWTALAQEAFGSSGPGLQGRALQAGTSTFLDTCTGQPLWQAPLLQTALALMLAHAASRAVAVVLMRALPYAGDLAHAKAKPLATPRSAGSMPMAVAWTLLAAALPCAAGFWKQTSVALIAAAVCAGICARWFKKRLGGHTGDTLGAAQQLTELAALLGWLAATHCAA